MTNKLKNVVSLPDVGSINAQASEWVVLLSDGDVTAENMAAFKVWYAKSEKHRLAFQARSELWGDLDLVSRLDDYAASEAVAELRREDRNILSTMPMGRRSVLGALAASIAVAAGATIVLDTSIPPSTEPEMRFQTAVGEQQEILLTDGSKVYLNTSSEVRVAFTDDARVLHLLRGEAHFDVESDPERAFSVVAGQNTITAIGTAFSVRRLDGTDKVDVKVSHGRVAVFDQPVAVSVSKILSREYSPMAEMTAGETALLGRTIEQVQTVTPKELARQLAWRDGVLAFAGDPLSDVVSEITRYTGVSIEIESETFKDYPISGYTKIGEYEEMFEALEIMTGLKAVRVSSDRVQLVEVEN